VTSQLVPIAEAQLSLGNKSAIHTSVVCCRVQSGRYRITTKRDRPLTYEMANPPHYIGHRKSWNSWNTCKLAYSYFLNLF